MLPARQQPRSPSVSTNTRTNTRPLWMVSQVVSSLRSTASLWCAVGLAICAVEPSSGNGQHMFIIHGLLLKATSTAFYRVQTQVHGKLGPREGTAVLASVGESLTKPEAQHTVEQRTAEGTLRSLCAEIIQPVLLDGETMAEYMERYLGDRFDLEPDMDSSMEQYHRQSLDEYTALWEKDERDKEGLRRYEMLRAQHLAI